mgnify:CR=1 FL=1
MKKGVSLIEILIVVAIFAVLGILISRVILTTLMGSSRSDNLVKVRDNIDYTLSVMERQIRNAESVSPCPNPDTTRIDFRDSNGIAAFFACTNVGASGYVASGSARLTNDEVAITACSLVCTAASGRVPPAVDISLEARGANQTGVERAMVTAVTKIFLRTY